MPRVVLWVDDAAAPATAKIQAAFQQAIFSGAGQANAAGDRDPLSSVILRDVSAPGDPSELGDRAADWTIPLTFNLPATLKFPAQAIYAACQDVVGVRQQVAQWGYVTGAGDLCLPIVLTAKGPLYAEVIGPAAIATANRPPEFKQPVHLKDASRQPLYGLSQRLLRSLEAPPAVYMMQFSVQAQDICFDRLLPFPDARAIASTNVQTPDLFACHWLCITHQPIHDLVI